MVPGQPSTAASGPTFPRNRISLTPSSPACLIGAPSPAVAGFFCCLRIGQRGRRVLAQPSNQQTLPIWAAPSSTIGLFGTLNKRPCISLQHASLPVSQRNQTTSNASFLRLHLRLRLRLACNPKLQYKSGQPCKAPFSHCVPRAAGQARHISHVYFAPPLQTCLTCLCIPLERAHFPLFTTLLSDSQTSLTLSHVPPSGLQGPPICRHHGFRCRVGLRRLPRRVRCLLSRACKSFPFYGQTRASRRALLSLGSWVTANIYSVCEVKGSPRSQLLTSRRSPKPRLLQRKPSPPSLRQRLRPRNRFRRH